MAELMKAAYTYLYPKVRELLNFNIDVEQFLNIKGNNWDHAHEPVIDKIVDAHKQWANLDVFHHRYQTSGASEGIFHVIASEPNTPIAVWRGEYEGYKAYAEAINREVGEFPLFSYDTLISHTWFISQPSAVNGCFLPDGLLEEMLENGQKVWLDLAYLTTTTSRKFIDLSHPNILGVFTSFSKPYGIYKYRFGVTYSRQPIQSLYGNKWFKSIPALMLAERLIDNIKPGILVPSLTFKQKELVEKLKITGLKASDVVYLAYSEDCDCSGFKRVGNLHRFCLTQYFEEME